MKTEKLTLEEMQEFIKNSEFEDLLMNEYDGNGNYYETEVRCKDGHFFMVYYCNGYLSPVRPKKINEEDWYDLIEVFPHKRMVEVTDWRTK